MASDVPPNGYPPHLPDESNTGKSATEEFANLLASYTAGSEATADQLMRVFYPELRRMAAARMRGERAEHSWQPTVLLHELYLELRKVKTLRPVNQDDPNEKAAFMGFAAHLMKRLLIHRSRSQPQRTEKVEWESFAEGAVDSTTSVDELELILSNLGKIDPKLRSVVELKVFEGLTEPEIAERLDCAPRTIARYWQFARRYLQQELGG